AAHREGVEALPEGGAPIETEAASVTDVPAGSGVSRARAAAKAVASGGKVDDRASAIARGEDPDQ
ncbi:MAG TPA: hypothetical protein VLT45_05940, partial [Kofleriaceae bacterium]|nr:hypothetical protein [Kofleriaceae bacterium]